MHVAAAGMRYVSMSHDRFATSSPSSSLSLVRCFFFVSFFCLFLWICAISQNLPTKLFVHANTIKWKRSYLHHRCVCVFSFFVQHPRWSIVWWQNYVGENFANTTKTRDARVRSVSVCVCVFIFRFFSLRLLPNDYQNWWTGNAVFIEVYAVRAQHTTNLTTTIGKKAFIFICIKSGRKKSKSKWFVALTHTHSTQQTRMGNGYSGCVQSLLRRRSKAIGLFAARL